MQGIRRTGFFRAVSLLTALAVLYSSTASSLNASATGVYSFLKLALQGRPGPYTERPRPIFRGTNPRREPRTRGGMWSQGALQDAETSKLHRLSASLEILPPSHALSIDAAPGASHPWEGSASTAGGSLNTGNGNKLTALPLVSWKDRGGMSVDFTLYHNSQGGYNDELGKGWTWSYDIYINEGQSAATVHWGDGTCIPFAISGGTYTAPAGIFDTLVKNGDGTWLLTTKEGTKYKFTTNEFCHEIEDRNGNKITLTLDTGNYCTRVTGPSGRYIDITVSSGNFTQIQDPLGRIWEFDIDGTADTLDTVEWPSVNSSTYSDAFTYDSSGRMLTHVDKRGKTWTSTYNSDGSLASETTPLSHTTSYTYASGATTLTFPGSQTNVHNYSSGRLASVVDAASFSESYTYNSSNLVTGKTDRRGKSWSYTYDSKGNVLTVTNPLSKVWTYTYNSANDLLTAEDPLDNVTTYTYDSAGNCLTIEDPLEHTTTFTYGSYGHLATKEDALENVTTYTFDTDGNLTNIEDPLSHDTALTYGDLGWLETVTDANGNAESFAYDEWGRVETVTHEDATYATTAYNANSQVTSVTNERGKTTSYAYDDSGRLTSVTNAKSEVESYAYNSNGWRTSVTNGRNKTRTYAFTSRGEVYTLTLPDSSVETWSYNGKGQVSAYTNPLSQTINYTYNDASVQTGIDYPVGTDTSFGYDDAGRRTSIVDSTGTTSWTYDDCDRVTAFDPPSGLVEYTYSADHSRATMDEDGVGVTSYTYDDAGRLTSLENPFSETTSFTYDDGNRLTRKTFDTGAYTDTAYDTRNRPTSITHKNSSNSTISSEAYEYDNVGNLTEKTVNSVVTEYGYDDIDQLTSESRSGYSASYTYDANGNRASKTLNGTTQSYVNDDADKLTSITQGGNTVKSFTYDTAGRTTAVTVSGNTTTVAYDYENRITTITYPNSSTNTFTYNGLDTRVGKVDSSGTKTYLRDGADVTDPVISDSAASYTPGISERRSSTTKFYHTDRLGSTERLVNTSQSTTDTREYDAFGLLTNSSGSTPTPFGFAGAWGYQEDPDSGLKLLGHRYYDPSTGRFLTRDVAKDGRNWYGYCQNNPTSHSDARGLQSVKLSPSQIGNLTKALADENWDYFFTIAQTAIGVEVPDEVVDLIKNIKRPGKGLLPTPGKVGGDLRNTLVHAKKIAEEPGSRAKEKWKDEIVGSMKKVYQKQKKG